MLVSHKALGLTSVTPGSGRTTPQIIYFLMVWGSKGVTTCLDGITVVPRFRGVHGKVKQMDRGLARGASSAMIKERALA